MAKLVVLYKKPKMPRSFDKHYASVHIRSQRDFADFADGGAELFFFETKDV
jgi:hypothetical protein